MIQWKRAYAAFQEGGYKSDGPATEKNGDVAVEFYTVPPKGYKATIDYAILFGDTKTIYNDLFPVEK